MKKDILGWRLQLPVFKAGKGTDGVSITGATAKFSVFDGGTFWVPPSIYLYIPKSARAYLFLQPVEIHYLRSGPISVDPICRRPKGAHHRLPAGQARGARFRVPSAGRRPGSREDSRSPAHHEGSGSQKRGVNERGVRFSDVRLTR